MSEDIQDQIEEQNADPIENETPAASESDFSIEDIVLNALATPTPAIKKFLDSYVQEELKKALAGKTPKKQTMPNKLITKEEFQKMDYYARNALYNENRALYNTLTQ